ncbi:MAG TPA: trimethylamine methyltransferase family protein [Anaerolineae bacterium]|nr:trimethylamine methyltransferase family protein [Anaerolineae bacterium]
MRFNYQVNITPQFRVLSDSQIEEIFHSALEVLGRVGTRVHSDEALNLLREAGCQISDGDRARIPAWLVQDALTTTPQRIAIAGRDRSSRVILEKNKIYFGTGSDCPSLVDPYSGEVRKYTFEDIRNAARISDALPHINFHMSLGLTSGVPAHTYDRHQFLAMLQGTSKPYVITAVDQEGLADQYRMACEVLGGAEEFARAPLFVAYIEPSSPLSNSVEAVEKILYAAETGIPAIYTPCIMCGATGPVTLAGGMTQCLAESLVGIVLAQLKRKGAGVIIGGVESIVDMTTSVLAYGAPEMVLMSAAMTDVAKWLRLPVFSTAGCSDSKTFDQQAAVESAMSVTVAALSGANLIHDVGYLESGLLGSYDMLVMSNEVIGMAKHILGGISVTPETLAVDVIEQAGPGGQYLTQPHTRKHFRSQMWFPELMDRQMRRSWEASGSYTLADRVRAKVKSILENHQPMAVPADVNARLLDIVAAADARHA